MACRTDLREERSSQAATAFAQSHTMDPRITASVPAFDVPFFQAGLAGYSDHAMRLTARRLGSPYCVTESMLDHALLTSRRKRRAEHPDRAAGEDRPLAGQIVGDWGVGQARALDRRRFPCVVQGHRVCECPCRVCSYRGDL